MEFVQRVKATLPSYMASYLNQIFETYREILEFGFQL
jgi:hypothetical protein